jgi:2Fe-2S ferredoxin
LKLGTSMGYITFIEHSGEQHTTPIKEGKSMMITAIDNGIPGIDADCAGSCACGTCHVIVDDNWIDALRMAVGDEIMILDLTPEKAKTSRLSCQINITAAMDGLIVRLPEFQM